MGQLQKPLFSPSLQSTHLANHRTEVKIQNLQNPLLRTLEKRIRQLFVILYLTRILGHHFGAQTRGPIFIDFVRKALHILHFKSQINILKESKIGKLPKIHFSIYFFYKGVFYKSIFLISHSSIILKAFAKRFTLKSHFT